MTHASQLVAIGRQHLAAHPAPPRASTGFAVWVQAMLGQATTRGRGRNARSVSPARHSGNMVIKLSARRA